MYKTIRHGENSLQYTILPQNDDFRIEGKLSNASCLPVNTNNSSSSSLTASASASATSSASSSTPCIVGGASKPRKRRTSFAYLGLIFVCTVIVGAVLIPFLVSAECLPSPTEWFLKTKAAFTHSGEPQQQQLHQLQHIALPPPPPAAPPTTAATTTIAPLAAVGQTVQIVNRNGVEQFILKLNKTFSTTTTTTTTSTTTTTTTTESPPTPTTTTTTTTEQPILSTTPSPPPPLSNRLGGTITTRIIQVPLLKSAAKKPIMPPVLAKTQSTQQQQQQQQQQQDQQQQQQQQTGNTDEAQINSNNNNNAWMNTRWAYIPSTYVQWSGYKAEDSVLLPALLGFALIGMILIITVCLVARNKRTIVSSVRKRNRNDIEEQGAEDNATLLTTTNLSDDD